jgi:hypothetical protein
MSKTASQVEQSPPFPAGALVRYQRISQMPGIAKNFRFVVMPDGRLFYAANKAELPKDPEQLFNTPLPDKPNRCLPPAVVDGIRQRLEEVDFFAQPAHQEAPARDGSLIIVTARQGKKVHEVHYLNVDNELTDFLGAITPEEPVERSPEEELSGLQALLAELQAQNKDLSED